MYFYHGCVSFGVVDSRLVNPFATILALYRCWPPRLPGLILKVQRVLMVDRLVGSGVSVHVMFLMSDQFSSSMAAFHL